MAREDVKQVVSAVVERREVEEAAVSGAEEQAKRRAAVLVELASRFLPSSHSFVGGELGPSFSCCKLSKTFSVAPLRIAVRVCARSFGRA